MTSSVIAAQGPDNTLWFYWQTIGTNTWAAQQVSGLGTALSQPAIAQVS